MLSAVALPRLTRETSKAELERYPPPGLSGCSAADRTPNSAPGRWFWQISGQPWDGDPASYHRCAVRYQGWTGGNARRVRRRMENAQQTEDHRMAARDRYRQSLPEPSPAATVMNVQLPRDPASSQRLQRALAHLLDEEHGNPIVRQTLSCFERELARVPDDVFPNDAGTGALPVMAWDDQQLRDPGDRIGQEAPRALAPDQRITGALQTVVEPPTDARLQQNAANQQTLGERYARDGTRLLQPLIADSPNASVGAALHPTIYHTGEGDWHKTPTACDEAHFRKFRLASINPKFRAAQEVPPAP